MSSSGKQIKFGAVLSYMAIFINIVSALIYTPWMLSHIGESDYGLFTLAHSVITLFLLDFGISAAVTRFVSKYKAEGEQEKINQFLGVVYKLFIIISAIIFVVLFVLYFFLDNVYAGLTPQEIVKFKYVFIISGVFSVVSFPLSGTVNGILTSYEKFIPLKICDVLHKIINVALIVGAILLNQGLYAFVIITAGGNLLTLVIKFIIIKSLTPIKIRFRYFDKNLLREIFSFSIWILVNSICGRLIMNLCPNILGIIPTAGTLAITIFSFASTIEGYTYIFANAIDGMFMPKIARIVYKEQQPDKLLDLMIKVGRFQFVLIGLIVIGFACVGQDFMGLWLAGRLTGGTDIVYWCALFLILPAPFYLSQQIGKNALIVMGRVKETSIINIIKAVLGVILVTVLTLLWGVLGACIAICIVYSVRNVLFMVLYQKILKLNMWSFIKKCYVRILIPCLITLALGLGLNYLLVGSGWLMFAIKVIIIIAIYLIFAFFIGLSKAEKQSVFGFIKKKLRIKGK